MHFDEAAATWDSDPAKIERARRAAELIRTTVPLSSTDRVLDVGGGTGQLSLFLADAVGQVVIADASQGMVDVARSNIDKADLGGRLDAKLVDLTGDHEPLQPASYDGVWSHLAMHHIQDLPLALRRLHDAVRPGGWVALVDLDEDSDGGFHRHKPDFHGHHGLGRNSFARDLENAGFTEVEISDAGFISKDIDGEKRDFSLFLAAARR